MGIVAMSNAYVHGYDEREKVRLQDQAGTLVELLHSDTAYPEGSRILEAGCGVGAQTIELAKRSPGAHFTSVDVSAGSLMVAKRMLDAAGVRNVELRQANILSLPFEPASFDHVFVCFVLEHLAHPLEALTKLKPLIKPGGTITLIEGDHGSAYFHPDNADAHAAIRAQIELQRRAGGNALIGRQLFPLLTEAGFTDVKVTPRMVYADGNRPELREGFTKKTFTAMIEGIGPMAVATGLIAPGRFDSGVRALHRSAEPDGVFCYTFFKAVANAGERQAG